MTNTFTKNTMVTFIARILQLIFGVVLAALIARVLGPEGRGVYYMALLLPTLMMVFTDIGVGTASVYFLGKNEYSRQEILGFNVFMAFITSVCATLLGFILILFFGNIVFPGIGAEYLYISLLLIPINIFFNYAINIPLGLQKIRKYNSISVLRDALVLIFVMILVFGLRYGIEAAIISSIVAGLITDIALYKAAKKEVSGISFRFKKGLLKDFLYFGSKVYFSNILGFIHYKIGIFLLNAYLNPAAVGLYSVATVISERIWLISQSASLVIFPKISSETNEKTLKEFTPLVCRNVLFVTTIIALFLYVFSPYIVLLIFSNEFRDAIIPFQILLIGSVAFSVARVISSDLAGRGKPIVDNYVGLFSTVLNVILNILLIPRMGITGAAWASSITYSLSSILMLLIYSSISKNSIKDILFVKGSDVKYYLNLASMIRNSLGRLLR